VARRQSSDVRTALTSILPDSLVAELAVETGAFRRVRKIGIQMFFWTLVLGFGTGSERTIAGLRRAFEQASGARVVASAFYDRFSAPVVTWLRQLAAHAIDVTREPTTRLRGSLASFRDVVATDATVIRLHDMLERSYRACRTNHTKAALKLHTVMSVNAAGPMKVQVTGERVHDGPVLKVGKWVTDRLLLFDLAYFRYQLFSCIRRNGGFFISRLKQSANPTIVAVHSGSAAGLIGQKVHDAVLFLKRELLDVEVEVAFPGRRYGGRRRRRTERFRVVGARNAETREYHLYITNVAPDRLSAAEIASAYAARWLIELFFRELKARYRADQLPSRKRHVVEALIYASLLTFIVSRTLRIALLRRLRASDHEVPDERWAVLFSLIADDLLVVVTRRNQLSKLLAERVLHLLLAEARDPNRSRVLLRARASRLAK